MATRGRLGAVRPWFLGRTGAEDSSRLESGPQMRTWSWELAGQLRDRAARRSESVEYTLSNALELGRSASLIMSFPLLW